MGTTSLGINYPESTELHPSQAWWRTLAETANSAILNSEGNLEETFGTLLAPIDARANLPVRSTVNGQDINNALDSQVLRHTTATGVLNLPPWDTSYSPAGITFIQVLNIKEGTTSYAAQVAYRYGAVPEMAWRVSRSTAGLWQEWTKVRGVDTNLDDAWARHGDLVSRARQRRGCGIGTGGLPAVALRFDHHTGPWMTKILPLLEARGLPWAQIINPSNVGKGDDTMTYAQLQDAALRSGGEVWNHGGNHNDAAYPGEAVREIPTALNALASALPRLAIEGFAPPGLSEGQYMGASPFKTVAQNTGTYTGQLILRNHAFVAGYAPGTYRTLDPSIQPIGAPHITMDSASQSAITSALNALGPDGVALMLHPNYLDQPGYMTTATFTAILDDIVARRDAGQLKVISYSGLWLADASTDRSDDLMSGKDVYQTGVWSGSFNFYRRENRAGSVREASVLVAGGSSVTFTLTVGTDTFTQVRPVPVGTGWRKVVAPFTIPADTGGAVSLTIDTGESGQKSQALYAI